MPYLESTKKMIAYQLTSIEPSLMAWTRRNGVVITKSHLFGKARELISAFSSFSPSNLIPQSRPDLSLEASLNTCRANSRVGSITIASGEAKVLPSDLDGCEALEAKYRGSKNAIVLPDPVGAHASRSLRANIMDGACI